MRTFWTTFLGTLALVILANIAMDPRAIVRKSFQAYEQTPEPDQVLALPNGEMGSRDLNPILAAAKPRIGLAVFGSSNAYSLCAETFQPGLDALILWSPAAELQDHLENWTVLRQRREPPQRIVWLFDPYTLNANDLGRLEEGPGGLKARYYRYLNAHGLQGLAVYLFPRLRLKDFPRSIAISEMTSTTIYYFEGQTRIALKMPAAALAEKTYVSYLPHLKDWKLDPVKVAALREALKDMKSHNVPVFALLPPVSREAQAKEKSLQAPYLETDKLLNSLQEEGLLKTNGHWLQPEELHAESATAFIDGNHLYPEFAYRLMQHAFSKDKEWAATLAAPSIQARVWAQRRPKFLQVL
jgi:hypothetical protein